jgi:hypothetical protein
MPFTLRHLREDVEDVGPRFDGAPDLEFRLATAALELERSGLGWRRKSAIATHGHIGTCAGAPSAGGWWFSEFPRMSWPLRSLRRVRFPK